jgi:hypothetical protein
MEILEDKELSDLTEGMSLDKVFFAKDLKDKYSPAEIKEKLNANV